MLLLIEGLVRGALSLVPCQPQAGFLWANKEMNRKFIMEKYEIGIIKFCASAWTYVAALRLQGYNTAPKARAVFL